MDSIESTYKALFGGPQFMMFVDESYEDFRQQIICLPYCQYESNCLPFEGISLTHKEKTLMRISQSVNVLTDTTKIEICLLLSSLKKYLVKKEIKRNLSSLISSLNPVPSSRKHIFYLYSLNNCRAYGYYNEVTQEFIILKGSLVAKSMGTTYAIAPRGTLRKLFIKEYCKELTEYYIVHTDIVCKSATMAASFVLGRVGSMKRWIDRDGRLLSEVYSFK